MKGVEILEQDVETQLRQEVGDLTAGSPAQGRRETESLCDRSHFLAILWMLSGPWPVNIFRLDFF